jgi:hypothetical protein
MICEWAYKGSDEKGTRRKIGFLCADIGIDGKIAIGHSKCNESMGDTFDKDMARTIAFNRMLKGSKSFPALSMKNQYFDFCERCEKYFKDHYLSGNTISILEAMGVMEDM